MSKKSLQTPQNRRSMLGFGSAAAKIRQQSKPPEQKRLQFSANKSRNLSTVGGKRWSSQGTHAVKDSRPLSNRNYQKQMIEVILQFLNDSGYPHQISTKILSAPTTKEFLRVFEHLYSFINSSFKMDKRYEEEVPRILKSLHYPFTISKSAMFAIGSLHTWPPLLGALQWMVELIRTVSSIDAEQMIFPESFADEECSAEQEKMFFEYFKITYQEFMLGTDDLSEAHEILQTAIIKQAGCSEEDHEALVEEVDELEKELALLEAEPEKDTSQDVDVKNQDVLEDAIKSKALLEEKIEQDLMTISQIDQESNVLKQQYKQFTVQMKEEGVDCAQLGDPARQEEIKHKSSEVKIQLERLNGEKERLEQQNNEREVKYSKLCNKFSAIVTEYNDIARDLSLNPMISQYIGENSIALKFDHNQKDLAGFNDCKHRMKPFLVKLDNRIAEDRYQLESQKITEEEELDKIGESCADKKCELGLLKTQFATIDKEVEAHIESLDKNYQVNIEKTNKQEEFLDTEQKAIAEAYEEDVKELQMKILRKKVLHKTLTSKIRNEEKRSAYTKEENRYAVALTNLCTEATTTKAKFKATMDSFNTEVKRQIKEELSLKEKFKRFREE